MPINYRIDGSVPVTHAIEPAQHDWSPFQNALRENKNRTAKEEEERQKALQEKANQAAEEAKYNPGNINDIKYNDSLNKIGQEVLEYSANGYKTGKIGTAEHIYGMGQLKNKAQLVKGKGDAALATMAEAYKNADQLPSYVDKTKLNKQIYDAGHPTKKNGDIHWDAINPEKIASIPSDYYHAINTADMYKSKIKDLGEKVHSTENMFGVTDPNDGTALGQMIRSDSVKAKFFKPIMDNKGNVQKWVPGVTDEAAGFMLDNDPEVKGEAKYQLDNYINAETTARINAGDTRDTRDIREVHNDVEKNIDARAWMRDHVKLNMERLNETSTDKSYKQGFKFRNPNEGKDEEDFKATKVTDQKRNLNVGNGTEDIRTTDVPEEYRFSGKKLDQPVSINSSKIYDENTNKSITGQESIGDKKLYPTRTFQIGYDTKTGKYIQGSIDDVKKNPNAVIKWMIGGTMDAKEEYEKDGEIKERPIKKNVMIPYEEVSNDIKAKYGFSLEDRDISDISDLELASYIKEQHPKATAQERLKIFNKTRGK